MNLKPIYIEAYRVIWFHFCECQPISTCHKMCHRQKSNE